MARPAHNDDHAEVISPTPQQDLELALGAMDDGDAVHAAHHLAGVLGVHPVQPGIDEAIARWLAMTSDPVALVPITGDVYRGKVALNALALAHVGRKAEAATYMLQLQAAAPELPLVERIASWLVGDDLVDPNLARIAAALNDCISHKHLCAALLPVCTHLLARYGAHSHLSFAAARAARNIGDIDQAIAIGEAAYRAEPCWMSASARAIGHRAKGDVEASIAAYKDAAKHDPNDLTAWLDIGDITLGAGRVDEASDAYDRVLEREPAHAWALPSRLYIRWRTAGDGEALARLLGLAGASHASSRAAYLAAQTDRVAHDLQPPSSATLNGLRQLEPGKTVKGIGTSYLESPSALLALQLVMRANGGPDAAVDAPEPKDFDPRVPRRKIAWPVWTYKAEGVRGVLGGRGIHARPALPTPPGEVTSAIAELAARDYSLAEWFERGSSIARTLGVDAAASLLAVTVHPPACPKNFTAWDWLFRVQVGAAVVLARLTPGWDGSIRQRALFSLLYGPVDWVTTASLIAVSEVARTEPKHTSEIIGLMCAELDLEVTPLRWTCIHEPLAYMLDRLPVRGATRGRLAELRRQAESG